MKLQRTISLVATFVAGTILFCSAAAQSEKLIIAGRDGGYAKALKMAVDMYKAENPGLEVERLVDLDGQFILRNNIIYIIIM